MWKKSSFSGDSSCVEVQWKKASFSGSGGSCVEVSPGPDDGVLVRDSKDPDGGYLTFTRKEWDAFIAGVKAREFDFA
jgi:hypothetical protein